jgi:hypothetical protein
MTTGGWSVYACLSQNHPTHPPHTDAAAGPGRSDNQRRTIELRTVDDLAALRRSAEGDRPPSIAGSRSARIDDRLFDRIGARARHYRGERSGVEALKPSFLPPR